MRNHVQYTYNDIMYRVGLHGLSKFGYEPSLYRISIAITKTANLLLEYFYFSPYFVSCEIIVSDWHETSSFYSLYNEHVSLVPEIGSTYLI